MQKHDLPKDTQTNEIDSLLQSLGGAKANPRRGLAYARLAREFVETYPPGSYLTSEEMDAFFRQSENVPKYSPSRRADWVERLRRSGEHPRRHKEDGPSFTVFSDHHGGWLVMACLQFMLEGNVLQQLDQFAMSQQRRLRYVAEGIDVEKILAGSREMARYLKLEYKLQLEAYASCMRAARQSARHLQEVKSELDQLAKHQDLLEIGAGQGVEHRREGGGDS